jgi:hypothetical protein
MHVNIDIVAYQMKQLKSITGSMCEYILKINIEIY